MCRALAAKSGGTVMLLGVVIAICVISILIGLIPLAQDHRSRVNQSFFSLLLSAGAWIISVNLQGQGTFNDLVLLDAAFVFATLMFACVRLFTHFLGTHVASRAVLAVVTVSVLFSVFAVASGNVNLDAEPVFRNGAQVALDPVRGNLYLPLLAVLAYLLTTSFIDLHRQMHRATTNELAKLGAVRRALAAGTFFGILLNVLLPNITSSTYSSRFAFVTIATWSFAITYAIVKHKLLEIRLIVARAVAYIVSLTLGAGIYFLSVFILFSDGVSNAQNEFLAQGSFFLLAIVTVFVAGKAKPRFDRISNSIFFRNDYSSEDAIKKISRLTVQKYDIDELTDDLMGVLMESIQPTGAYVLWLDANADFYSDYHYGKLDGIDAYVAAQKLINQKVKLFDIETYERDKEDPEHRIPADLSKYLKDHRVSISLKVSTNSETVGYVLLGAKSRGDNYSNKDQSLLNIAANEMAVAIQNARRFDEIKRFNETLKLEIDRATKELRDSNEKLQALDQAKDEFISMASHQLRTPLTSVKGYLSMVLEGDVGKVEKQQRDLLAAAFTSSQRMVYLIADLLNVSRLQTGKFVIEPMLSDLPTVVESEIDQLKETAKAKDLKVTFKKPKKFPQVYIDETKTRQVIMNFIDNAIYYTPAGGKIEVQLIANDKKIEYTVSDNGIGVPKSEQKNMFTKFYRATNAKKARPDGTGLGLFMAKKVIVDQGGALIFHSKEGEGSTFGFTFPLTRVRPPKKKGESSKKTAKKSSAKGTKQSRKGSTKRPAKRSAK